MQVGGKELGKLNFFHHEERKNGAPQGTHEGGDQVQSWEEEKESNETKWRKTAA